MSDRQLVNFYCEIADLPPALTYAKDDLWSRMMYNITMNEHTASHH